MTLQSNHIFCITEYRSCVSVEINYTTKPGPCVLISWVIDLGSYHTHHSQLPFSHLVCSARECSFPSWQEPLDSNSTCTVRRAPTLWLHVEIIKKRLFTGLDEDYMEAPVLQSQRGFSPRRARYILHPHTNVLPCSHVTVWVTASARTGAELLQAAERADANGSTGVCATAEQRGRNSHCFIVGGNFLLQVLAVGGVRGVSLFVGALACPVRACPTFSMNNSPFSLEISQHPEFEAVV